MGQGGTHAEELWGAVFFKKTDAKTVHVLGGGICYFDADSNSEHEDYHGNCDPCSEGERDLEGASTSASANQQVKGKLRTHRVLLVTTRRGRRAAELEGRCGCSWMVSSSDASLLLKTFVLSDNS